MIKSFIKRNNKSLATLSSVVIGFVVAAIVMMIFGVNAFQLIGSLISGIFENKRAIHKTITLWALYIFLGLSVMIGFKIGIFNIGVAGQMTFGMCLSYLFVFNSHMAIGVTVFIAFIITVLGAIVFAMISAALKIFFNVHEVVTTIMLNWIAVKILNLLIVKGKIHEDSAISGGAIARMPDGVNANIDSISQYFSWMFFIAIIAVAIVFVIMKYTKIGRKLLVTGSNPVAAQYSGYSKKTIILITFGFSGLVAGLAGFTYFYSIQGVSSPMSKEGMKFPLDIGFLGIAIALVGMNSTIGVMFSALFFAILNNPTGILKVQTDMSVPSEVIQLFSSVIIYFVAIVNLFIYYVNLGNIKKFFLEFKNIKQHWANFVSKTKAIPTNVKNKFKKKEGKNV